MKKICTLLVCAALCVSSLVMAQPNYSFTAVSGTYTALSGGTVVSPATTGSSFVAADEGAYNNIPIGFTFTYNGTNYTTIHASTNGFACLGNSIPSPGSTDYFVNNLSTNGSLQTSSRPLLAPLWDDLALSDPAVSGSQLSYLTSGTSPNRIFTLEFKNAQWNFLSNTNNISFQIKLYETSNIIEFQYKDEGGGQTLSSPSASIGITTTSTGSCSFLSLSSSGTNPSISSTTETTTISTRPADGQIYRFTPGSSASNDLCANAATITPNAGTTSGTIIGATNTSPFTETDVWYTFTATCSSAHTITLNNFTGDLDLALFSTSCPASNSPLASSIGTGTSETMTTPVLTSGTTYYIRVFPKSNACGPSTFDLSITSPTGLTLSNTGTPAAARIYRGNTDIPLFGFTLTPASCASYPYDFTAVTISKSGTATTSDISNLQIVYDADNSGTYNAGDYIASNSLSLAASMSFTMNGSESNINSASARRYLLIGTISGSATYGNTFTGSVSSSSNITSTLSVSGTASGNTQTIAPDNNLCPSAISLTVGAAATSGTLSGADFTLPFTSGNDVWYSFTAACTGQHSITVSSIASGTVAMQVWASSCPASTSGNLSLASGSASGTSSFTGIYNLTGGTTYYVRVYESVATASTFSIAVAAPGGITLDNTGAPAAGVVYPNTNDNVISGFRLTPDACASGSYDITAVKFTISGVIISADINSFRLVYDADNSGTYNGGDVIVSSTFALASPLNINSFIVPQTGLTGTRRYLLIANIPSTATPDRNITASIAAATDITSTASISGTATCNQQTIAPANDFCGSPTSLTLNTTSSSNSLTNATITSPFAEKDVWYSFTPACSGTYNFTIGSPTGGTFGIQVFNVSCPATTTTGLQTSTGGSTSGSSAFSGGYSLVSGTTYYIRVYAVSGSPSTFTITAANTVTVNNTGAPAAGNHLQGATNRSISGFTVVPGCTSSYTVSTVKFTTSGTATSSDFVASSFKVYRDANANNTYDNGTDVLVSAAGQTFASTMTFTLSGSYSASQAFFLVCDINSAATAGRTIIASIADASTDITLTSPIGAYGSATGNTQTIVGTLATDDYRSRATGNWATASTWESFNAGTGWITASAAPTSSANSITIQSGHTVTIAAAATAQELTIQSGGILNQSVGQTFSISNGPSAIDFNILNGGIYVVNGSVPTFVSSATMEVQSGGIVRVDGQTSTAGQNQSDVFAYSSASYPTVIFRTGSIYQWNVSNAVFAAGFTTAGVTYFPNATGEVPIFRVSAAQTTKTPTTACVINGKYEHNSGISFGWAGTASKTFRDGLGGAGTITFFPGGGSNFITGSSAVIDGTVTINVNNSANNVTNNLTVSSGANVTVSGSPIINIGGTAAGGTTNAISNLTISSGATCTMSGTPTLAIGNQTSNGIANLNIAGTFTSTSSNPVRMDYFGTNTLNITGSIGAGNTATFTPNNAGLTNLSSIIVNSTGSVGTLAFTSGFQTVKNFTLTSGSVTMGSNMTVHSSGTHTMTAGTLVMNGNTLTLSGAVTNTSATYTGSSTSNLSINGSGTITGNFNFTAGSQNLAALTMNRSATTATIGTDLTLNAASTITAGTVTSTSGTILALSSSLANSGTLNINGTLQMNTGSSLTGTAPTYASSSTLLYNPSGAFSVSNEWTGSSTTVGLGVPQNVTVQNTGTVIMPSTDRGMAGNMNINAGTFALNATSGNLSLAGNWTRVSTATFTPNNRTVSFSGTAAQSINVSGGGTETFYNLTNSNTSADVTMNNDVTVSSTFTPNASSVFAVNGNTLTLNGTASGTGTLRGSSSSNVTVGGTSGGSVGTIYFTSGAQTLNNFTISRTGSGATAALGTNLTVDGALAISNAAASLSWGSNTLTLSGTISGSGTLTGSSSSNLTVGGTSGSLGTMSFTSGSQTLNALTMSRTGVGAAAAAVLGSDLTSGSITLTNGILATGNNLLTWSNAGGTLTAPNIPYATNNTSYKNSYICLCDAAGTALSFTPPFDGSIGFRVNNVSSATAWLPVGVDFTAPNRMNISNTGTTDNFTVVMAKTDIGNTLPNVNRVWYVNEGTTGGSIATVNLFFTKQTPSQYIISQDEVEASFDYTNTLLAQKDYSGNYLNISSNPSSDKIDNSSNTLNTEVYAKYTTGVSKDVSGNTNGINNFNRFTIVNALSNDLCANAVNITVNGGTTAGDMTGATFSTPFTSGNDVWYSFTASCTGTHPITVSSIASGTLGVQVWSSSCPASTSGNIALASGSASGSSSFTGNYSLTSGVTYYVRVYTVSGTPSTFNIAVTGTGNLNLSNTGAPAAGIIYPNTTNNPVSGFTVTPDACLTSYDLTSVKFTLSGLIITADINNFRLVYDADNSGTYNGGDQVVSVSYALASPTLTMTFTSQTGLSGTRRYLLIADVPNTATVDHYLTYSIAAAADLVASTTVVGTATCNQQTIGPANDLCGSPTALTLNTTLSSQSMTNATITSPFAEKDMWYSFTPTCTGTYNISIGSIAAGTVGIQVFNVSCPATTISGLQTSTGGSTSGTSSFSGGYSFTSGTTYYIRVYAVSGSPSTFTITAANTVTVNNTGAPAAGNHLQGATNRSISGFTVVPGCTSSYTVSTVKFTTSGTATSSDFVASSFKVYRDVNTNNTYDNGTDVLVSAAGQTFGATMTFTLSGSYSASQAFFLVCDINSAATAGRTIIASIADASTDITLTSPIGAYGSATGNTQTIVGTLATDDYRTQASGNWATAATWQSYNASTGWITASAAPTSSANSIIIQNGHTVTIAAAATAEELTIQSGGILNQAVGQTLSVSNGPSAIDFNILSGGIFIVNGSVPTFVSSATMEVQSGGIIRVDGQTSTAGQNQSDVLAYSSASYPTVIFRTGSIYQWNVSNAVFAAGFTTAGVTYFPNATGEVPIFRISAAQATKTPGTACIINGKYEHNSGISFGWAGTASKTFRDGFGGAGTITFFPGGGSNFITGSAAVIDGTVTINVNNSTLGVTNNLIVSSGSNVTVSGSPIINIGGTVAGAATGTANLTISSGANWTMSGTPTLAIGNQASSGIANLNIAGTFTSTSSNPVRMDYFGTNTLNITGSIGAGNTATFTPNNAGLTNLASVIINSATAGTLTFTSGFQTVKNFTLTSGSVTMGSNMTVHSSGTHTMTAGTLVMNGNTLTLSGAVTNTSGTYTGSSTSNLSINGSGTITGNFNFTAGSQNLAALTMNRSATTAIIGTDLTLNAASTITAGTVTNSSGTILALSSSLANSGTLNINGTLQMNTGSSVPGTAPTYSSSSTLQYNSTGTFTVGNEWTGNATTAGLGIPQNVTVQNTGMVSMPSADRGLAGNLTISSGTLALNASSGNLYVAGNWTNSGAFTHNNRTVFFNGSAAQSINGTTATGFYNLTDNNTSADVTMNQSVTVSNILSLNTSSILAINGNTLTLSGTLTGAGSLRGSSSSDLVMTGTGQVGTLRFVSGGQTLNLISINRTGISNNYAALLATDLTVNALTLNNGIIATGSNLFAWTKTGSLLPAAQTSYTANSTSYKNSYVCICDGTGTGLSVTEPYDGTKGFRVSNVGTDVWFPIGVDFKAPNRMWIDNSGPSPLGTSDNVTVAIVKETWGGAYPKVERIWYVKEGTTGGTSANMRLYFTKQDNTQFGVSQDEVENGFDYTDIHLTQKNYSDNNFLDVSQSTDIKNGLSNTNGTELYADYNIGVSPDVASATDGINYFSRFMVANAPAFILPVTVTNLTASESAGIVKLGWTSVDEVNISHYEIERSANASAFSYIGRTDAKNNGAIKTDYTFSDIQPLTGNNYYRLKIVEKDGSTFYSNIVHVTIKQGKTFITIIPNPVPKNSASSVQFNNVAKGEYHLVLYSNSGTILSSQVIAHSGGTAVYRLQLPAGIATGMYVLKVNGMETSFTVKLVVE